MRSKTLRSGDKRVSWAAATTAWPWCLPWTAVAYHSRPMVHATAVAVSVSPDSLFLSLCLFDFHTIDPFCAVILSLKPWIWLQVKTIHLRHHLRIRIPQQKRKSIRDLNWEIGRRDKIKWKQWFGGKSKIFTPAFE